MGDTGHLTDILRALRFNLGQLAFSLIMIVGLYTLFLIAEVYLMQKYARLGPSAMQSEQPTQQQG